MPQTWVSTPMEVSVVNDIVPMWPDAPGVQNIALTALGGRGLARVRPALAAILGVAAAFFLQIVPAASTPRVSEALRSTLLAAQAEVKAKNWPAVITKTNEAAANPKKQPYDQHIVDEWQGFAYANLQDWPNAARHFEATLNDGFLAAADQSTRLLAVTQSYYNAGIKSRETDKAAAAGYLDKVIQYGSKAIEGGAPADCYTLVVTAAYVREDYKTAAKYEQQLVDNQLRQKQIPSAFELEMLRSAYFKMGDMGGLLEAFRISLAYHPTADLWEQAVSVIAQSASHQPASELQLYRLMLEAKVLKRSGDYTEFADTALRQGSPGEAKAILEQGFASNVFPDALKADNQKLLQSATMKAQADQASLPEQTREVQAAPTGPRLYALGLAYFGYQQYEKAADLLSQALARGGLENEANTRLLLGVAQLKTGRQSAALRSFGSVRGDPALAAIAELWATRLGSAGAADTQGKVAAASTVPPPAAVAAHAAADRQGTGAAVSAVPPAAPPVAALAAPPSSAPAVQATATPAAMTTVPPPQGPALLDLSVTWYPERRLALVIGNSTYGAEGTIWPDLQGGPLKDADAMAALLRKLGFEVILAKDEDLDQMNASLRQLSQRIRANPDSLALLYYSGHGTQAPRTADEEGQDNYLIPVRTNLSFDADARSKALSLTDIRSVLRHSRAAVVILDACRNNGLRRPPVRAALTRGLASVENTTGMLIAYSTSAGEVAINRPGRMSQYTEVLVRELDKPGMSLTTVFRSVRRQLAQSGAAGLPELMDALNDDIVLVRPLKPAG